VNYSVRVLETIRDCGPYGATADEVSILLGIFRSTVAARISELWRDGLLRDSLLRRETRFGKTAIVWKVA
jgi:hypothetical protein